MVDLTKFDVVEYIILAYANYEALARQVNVKLKEGYIPSGGVTMNATQAAQAMIKLERK